MTMNDSVNAFAWNLYTNLNQGASSDVFFSPYSIAVALAMTYAGARNRTAEQLSNVMKMDGGVHQRFKSLNETILSPSTSYSLKSANRLYIERSYDLLESFVEVTETNYEAGLVPSDFKRNAEKVRADINEWVSAQTAGKIRDLIAPGGISSTALLVLVNAIYFKGTWSTPFSKMATYKHPFHVSPTTDRTVDMMAKTDFYYYFEDNARQCQVLGLPYKGNRLRMVAILPKRSEKLATLENRITPEVLSSWTKAGTRRKVHVRIPRFKLESTLTLNEQLTQMGASDLFSASDADLSGMSGSRDIHVSQVIHKAFVEVNEEGTEAAAATFMAMAPTCALPTPEVIPVFEADRPFICFISDDVSGVILFLGKLVTPRAGIPPPR